MPFPIPVRRVYDFNPIIRGWKRPRGRPKTRWADSIKQDINFCWHQHHQMLPRWYFTLPSGRPLLADCQRSNPSKALKSSKSSWGERNRAALRGPVYSRCCRICPQGELTITWAHCMSYAMYTVVANFGNASLCVLTALRVDTSRDNMRWQQLKFCKWVGRKKENVTT